MATERRNPEHNGKWRMRLRKVLIEWARCRELPESAIVELEVVEGRANVVVTEPKADMNCLENQGVTQ